MCIYIHICIFPGEFNKNQIGWPCFPETELIGRATEGHAKWILKLVIFMGLNEIDKTSARLSFWAANFLGVTFWGIFFFASGACLSLRWLRSQCCVSYNRCFIPRGLEREMQLENAVIQHTPTLILPTSQTQVWTRIYCSRELCSLSKFDRDNPKLCFWWEGVAPTYVPRNHGTKHHNGHKTPR